MFGLSYGQASYGGHIPFEETENVFPYCPEPSKSRYNPNIYTTEEQIYSKINVYSTEEPYTALATIYTLTTQYSSIKPYNMAYPYLGIIPTYQEENPYIGLVRICQ